MKYISLRRQSLGFRGGRVNPPIPRPPVSYCKNTLSRIPLFTSPKISSEPLFSHSGRFQEKRDFGGSPKSLLGLRWCLRRDSNHCGFPHPFPFHNRPWIYPPRGSAPDSGLTPPGGPTSDCEVNCETDPAYGNLPDTKAGEPILRFPRLFPTIYNSCLIQPPLFYLTQNPVGASS